MEEQCEARQQGGRKRTFLLC